MHTRVLHWGIKSSLIEYITDMGGEIEIRSPATSEGNGFIFPQQRMCTTSHDQGVYSFDGGIRMTAHGGILDVTILSPRVVLGLSSGYLEVSQPDGTVLTVATLTVRHDRTPCQQRWDATLTSAAGSLFGRMYPSGTVLDPVTLRRQYPVDFGRTAPASVDT